ncbi:MAG: hypothetical protein V1773_10820 [bacterium]
MSSKISKSKKHLSKPIDNPVSVKIKKATPKWFYLITLLIPVLFFVLLEFSLRMFNYGQNIDQWVKATEDQYMLNPDIAYRYFYSTKGIPYSSKDIFYINKRPNTFRVFVLGESSAAGFPSAPGGTFPRYIEKRLQLLYPNKYIEMVNISMSAINTYTLRNLLPGVIEQKPDLVIFYVGHNEYYGALGVGSMESLGAYRSIVNLMLSLNEYKTIELLRNTIKTGISLFSGDDSAEKGTLMSRMAKDQYIPINSNKFILGLKQFDGNMRDMIDMLKGKHIPVILGNLTCNLLDQKPFISDKSHKTENAMSVYNKAKERLKQGDIQEAKKLFIKAKDLDMLRFRAPEQINYSIKQLGKEFNIPVVNIDSAFCSISKYGIPGNDLMTDHLHPTISGYNFMGKLYFEQMVKSNYLPAPYSTNIPLEEQNIAALSKLKFSHLDSLITRYRITILKSDWPYIERRLAVPEVLQLFNIKNYLDSLSLYVVDSKLSWEKAHRNAAVWYLAHGNVDKFIYEMDLLIDIYPVITDYYPITYNQLLQVKAFDKAYFYLEKEYNITPNAFNTKWLGIIDLSQNKIASSIKYLEESLGFNNTDAQILFNLAGAYVKQKDFNKALLKINQCLNVNPNFPGALQLQKQLKVFAR